MAKAERIAAKQREIEETGLCPFYGGRCDGVCNIPSDIAQLIVDYRTKGRSNLNHGITEAFSYQAFSIMDQAKHIGAEVIKVRNPNGAPIMKCKGHDRWAHGHEKVKKVQSECWLPGLLEKMGE